MRFFRFLDAAIIRLGTASLAVAAVFIGLLAIIGTADSLGTQLFALPVASALEMSQAGLVIVVFMGLAYAQRRRATRVLEGAILGNMFFEASTRTRISFGSAFNLLGGEVRESVGMDSLSLVKGARCCILQM